MKRILMVLIFAVVLSIANNVYAISDSFKLRKAHDRIRVLEMDVSRWKEKWMKERALALYYMMKILKNNIDERTSQFREFEKELRKLGKEYKDISGSDELKPNKGGQDDEGISDTVNTTDGSGGK